MLFWYYDVTAYFHTAELLFDQAGILNRLSRYPKLIHALTKHVDVMKTLRSVLQSLSGEHPHINLKNRLLRQYAQKQKTSIPVLLQTFNCRGESVTNCLIRLKSLLGESYEHDSAFQNNLSRHYLMQSVDFQHQAESLSLRTSHIDRVCQSRQSIACTSARYYQPLLATEKNSNPSDQQLINELLRNLVAALQLAESDTIT